MYTVLCEPFASGVRCVTALAGRSVVGVIHEAIIQVCVRCVLYGLYLYKFSVQGFVLCVLHVLCACHMLREANRDAVP